MSNTSNNTVIRSVLWFLPATGDNRYVGSAVGSRSPTFDYLQQVARAADTLGLRRPAHSVGPLVR